MAENQNTKLKLAQNGEVCTDNVKRLEIKVLDIVFRDKNNAAYRADLDKKGYKYEFMETPGGHVWTCWRIYLSVFAPKLFK